VTSAASPYLHTTELIDCTGRITHSLTVEPDGSVAVRVGNVSAVVHPGGRSVHPPGFRLGAGEYSHEQVVDLACQLARVLGR
jgi:hypothetical protein